MYVLRPTLVLLCVGIVAGHGQLTPNKHREALLETTVFNTQKFVAPSGTNGTIRVSHAIQASVISLENNVLELLIWNNMFWKDERLSWDSDRFGSTMEMHVPSELIWVPDISVRQSVEPIRPGFQSPGINAIITHEGDVTYIPAIYLKTKCVFDESDIYLRNSVECRLTFMSWSFTCNALDINPLSYSGGDDIMLPSEWNIESIEAKHNVIKYNCCPQVYCDVTYTLTLRRNTKQ